MFIEVKPTGKYRTNLTIDDKCKICGKITSPIMVDEQTKSIDIYHYRLAVTRYCLQCCHYFIDEFDVIEKEDNGLASSNEIILLDVKPELPSDIPISDNIALISPIGKDIYLQALKAEQEKLDHIAGIGFRKALEFFVKDLVIALEPDNKDKVINMQLKQVIETYVDYEDLKTFSLASAYVGNDESHYFRKHSDKDLQHLKKYLHGFLYYMEMKLNFLDAQEFVNRSKKA